MSLSSLSSLFALLFGLLVYLPNFTLSCQEKITVTECVLSAAQSTSDFSIFEGDYYFWGFDSTTGYPRYVHPPTMAEISIDTNVFNSPYLAVSFSVPGFVNAGVTFGPTTWVGSISSFGEIVDVPGFSSPTNYAIRQAFFGYDPVTAPFLYSFFFTNFFPVRMLASLDDCPSVGLSYEPDTTVCPTYIAETYNGDCVSGQDNCQSCNDGNQCGTCDTGFYKMAWNEKCQSCTDSYKNCDTCQNWNGCTTCNSGFSLGWSQVCGDEVCE